jgi:hypothetical protein
MWRSKKLIIVTLLAAVVLTGSLGGIALANGEDDNQPEARYGALLDRVCEIYQQNTGVAIEPEALEDAFAQARSEERTEFMRNHLQGLVEQGEITQQQADEFLQWQQARPDVPFGLGFKGHGRPHGFPEPCMMPWNGQ